MGACSSTTVPPAGAEPGEIPVTVPRSGTEPGVSPVTVPPAGAEAGEMPVTMSVGRMFRRIGAAIVRTARVLVDFLLTTLFVTLCSRSIYS